MNYGILLTFLIDVFTPLVLVDKRFRAEKQSQLPKESGTKE